MKLFPLFAAAAVLLTASVQAQGEQSGNPFGAVEAFWLPEAACDAGLGWERIIFDWSQIQPESAEDWNPFNVPDEWLQNAADCGREVIAIVKHTPAWATEGTPGIGLPRGLDLPVDDPANLWAAFMARLAVYYGERGVSRFIIWNEPDIPAGAYGYEFEGTVDDYARLLSVAYRAVNDVAPGAEIIVAGTTYWHDVNARQPLYLERLLTALGSLPGAAGNGYFFDALALHIYFRADTVYTITHTYADLLASHGLADKQLWIVETNASPNLDPLWPVTRPQYQITLDQQADFLIQAAALGLAAGADRIGVYKFFDWTLPAGAESFGLIRADESQRPALNAWSWWISQFADVQMAALAQNDQVNVVRLNHRADGRLSYVAWARTGEPVILRVTAGADSIQAADGYGTLVSIPFSDGEARFVLPAAQCSRRDGCPVGGAPIILTTGDQPAEMTLLTASGPVPLSFTEEMQVYEQPAS
jgi:hypothetical protein